MPELKLTAEPARSRIDVLVDWLPRIALAAFFVLIVGSAKLSTNPRGMWVNIFARIGLGQWFRYVTGVVQVAGGLLLLVPKTAAFGAALLACTMAGAVVAQIVVFRSPAAVIPAALFGIVVAVGWRAWDGRRS